MDPQPTNIIGVVETPFIEHARKMLQNRDSSFDLCVSVWNSIDMGANQKEVKDLIAVLINEVHALQKQLNKRHF